MKIKVGIRYFPSQESANTAAIFWNTQSAFNGGDPIHMRNGVMDINSFSKTTGPAPVGFNVTSIYNPTSASNANGQKQYWADCCVIGYGFDNYKGGEPLDADGISVLGQAGSQLVTLLRVAPNGTYFTAGILPTIHLERTRYIVLKNGALRVEGV